MFASSSPAFLSNKPSFFAAALAKLRLGRTFGVKVGLDNLGDDVVNFGAVGSVCEVESVGGGVRVLFVKEGRSVPVRELVRDIVKRSLLASRSFSKRSATSFSLEVTSTGLENALFPNLAKGA